MASKKSSRAGAGAGTGAGALPTWRAKLGLVTIRVGAQCWYDARNEAARRFRASPMDVACDFDGER